MPGVEQGGQDQEPQLNGTASPSTAWEDLRLRIDGQVFLPERPLGAQDPFTYYRLGPDSAKDADDDANPFNQHALRPPRPHSTLPRSSHLWVDGELLRVARQEGRRQSYDYSRLTGPDSGHGFSTGTGGTHWDLADHLEQCRWFLWIVDPITGHIEDD